MTDKQYYCQNGDLIEVGKCYKWSDLRDDGDKVKVIGIDTDRGVPVAFVDGEYWGMALNEMQSLWQEPKKMGVSNEVAVALQTANHIRKNGGLWPEPQEESKDKLTAREFYKGQDRLIVAGDNSLHNLGEDLKQIAEKEGELIERIISLEKENRILWKHLDKIAKDAMDMLEERLNDKSNN
jgi:hypothetical protein